MSWTDIVIEMKAHQYTMKETLDYIKTQKKPWTIKSQAIFEKVWKSPVIINVDIEDIFPEIDLPRNLVKLTDFQKRQIINVYRHLDKEEAKRRTKLVNIMLNIVRAKKRSKDIENFRVLSDILYEANMLRKIGATNISISLKGEYCEKSIR